MTKYYSTQRPLAPGCFPREGVIMVTNFDEKKFCEEIGREAWGYVTYAGDLTPEAVKAYELIREGMKRWWAVTSAYYNDGSVIADITDTTEAVEEPQRQEASTKLSDIYIEWFPSEEEAQKYVEECRSMSSRKQED